MNHISIMLDVEYKTKPAKFFRANIYSDIELNNLFMVAGANSFNEKTIKGPLVITTGMFYRAMSNIAISFLEHFFIVLLIEIVDNPGIKTKDDLLRLIRRDFKISNRKRIGFQNLDFVRKYIMEYTNQKVDIKKDSGYNHIKVLFSERHLNTHSYGLLDDEFKSKNPDYLNNDPEGVAIFPNQESFVIDLADLQMFVKYIDDNVYEYMQEKR